MTPPSGFDEYVAARNGMLLRFAYLLCGDHHRAEDLVQDVLVRAHRRWPAIEVNPDAYLKQALVRAHLSWRRRRAATEVVTTRLPELVAVGAHDEAHAARDAAWNLLATLPRAQRTVLVLRYFEDLDDRRIAELTGSSPGAVRMQAHRGLTRLRETLTDETGLADALARRDEDAPGDASMVDTVRQGTARASRRRRAVILSVVALVVAAVAALVPLLRPWPAPLPIVPSPSSSPSPSSPSPTPSTGELVTIPFSPPTFPYAFTWEPASGLGERYVSLDIGQLLLVYEVGFVVEIFEAPPPRLDPTSTEIGVDVNGQPGTLRTTVTEGASLIELFWPQDGQWLGVASFENFTADDVLQFGRSVTAGTTTSTNDAVALPITSIQLPAGYVIHTNNGQYLCALPPGIQPDYELRGQIGRPTGLCIGQQFAFPGMEPTVDSNLTIDGWRAWDEGWRLTVERSTFLIEVFVSRDLESEFTLDDLIAIYHGITVVS